MTNLPFKHSATAKYYYFGIIKLSFYREFYEFGKRASYVDELTNRNDRSHLAKLRLSDHSLEH